MKAPQITVIHFIATNLCGLLRLVHGQLCCIAWEVLSLWVLPFGRTQKKTKPPKWNMSNQVKPANLDLYSAYWIRINLSHILAFHSSNLKHFRIPLFASMCLISMLGDLVHNKNARISSLCATVLANICKHMCRCAFHHNTITYPHPHTHGLGN